MLIALQLAAAALLATPGDTRASAASNGSVPGAAAARLAVSADVDTTPRRRPRAVEVSDGYALRLRIHRYASYATIPLFAAQSVAGNQMYQSGSSDPSWAKSLHTVGAGGLAVLFTVNTVTGVWNLWESRGVREGRGTRLAHGALMLASDAGFAYAGAKLGPEATRSGAKRQEHRRLALISMGTALTGYATMLVANR